MERLDGRSRRAPPGWRARAALAAAYLGSGAAWSLWAGDDRVLLLMAPAALAAALTPPGKGRGAWLTRFAIVFLAGGTFAAVVLGLRVC